MTQRETDLEHELAAALIKVDDQRELLRLSKEENEEKRKDIVYLATEKAKLENYVMRLEEAGDAMVDKGWNEPHLAGEWRKSKEAKP